VVKCAGSLHFAVMLVRNYNTVTQQRLKPVLATTQLQHGLMFQSLAAHC
jgi:hypothetical protein